jgi:hypothetical protein
VLCRNVLYLVTEGGILTTLDGTAGSVLKQRRRTGALDFFYSSPVAAATPAPVDQRLYVRTRSALYCFGND